MTIKNIVYETDTYIATKQKYGESVSLPKRETGFYDSFQPLKEDDIAVLRSDIESLLQTEKYTNF